MDIIINVYYNKGTGIIDSNSKYIYKWFLMASITLI